MSGPGENEAWARARTPEALAEFIESYSLEPAQSRRRASLFVEAARRIRDRAPTDLRTVRTVQTRANLLRPGDVCRKLEWEDRRPSFRMVAGLEELASPPGVIAITWVDEHSQEYPTRANPYDLFELQVVDEPRPTPGETP